MGGKNAANSGLGLTCGALVRMDPVFRGFYYRVHWDVQFSAGEERSKDTFLFV